MNYKLNGLLGLFAFSFNVSAFAGVGAPLTSCIGQSLSLAVTEDTPFVNLPFRFPSGSVQTGWFLVDFGSNLSHLDPDRSPKDADGKSIDPQALWFFAPMPFPEFSWSDFSQFKLSVDQVGIVGTNVLAQDVYTLDAIHHQLYQSSPAQFCADSTLRAAGFVPLTTTGYFVGDPKTQPLFPLEHIKPSTPNPLQLTVPNIPTLPIRIAGVPAVAQMDTGFSDRVYPFSVNINTALLNAINQSAPLLVRADEIPVTKLTTCVPNAYTTMTAYRLVQGQTLDWIAQDGRVARSFDQAIYFLKEVSPEAEPCEGIGTWEIPAAQLGASFLKSFGLVIFNGTAQTLWVPTQP